MPAHRATESRVPHPVTPPQSQWNVPPQTAEFRWGQLADAEQSLQGLTKAMARQHANNRIRDILTLIAPPQPHKTRSNALGPYLSLGDSNYLDAGRYYQLVSQHFIYHTTNLIASSVSQITLLNSYLSGLQKSF